MSSGLHGTNGIDPTTSYNIYKLYVLPRLLYGLEILALKTRDIEKLDRYIETISVVTETSCHSFSLPTSWCFTHWSWITQTSTLILIYTVISRKCQVQAYYRTPTLWKFWQQGQFFLLHNWSIIHVQSSIDITFTKEFTKEVTMEKDDYDINFILLEWITVESSTFYYVIIEISLKRQLEDRKST